MQGRETLADLRDPLLVASAVWNEVVAQREDLDGAVANVAEMIEEFQQQPVSARFLRMLEALAARKLGSFGSDDRLVAELEVHRQGADVGVVARTRPVPPPNAVLVPRYMARSSARERAPP
jgi:hypothetical protein